MRALENSHPYIMIDVRYEKVRRGGEVISRRVLHRVGYVVSDYHQAARKALAEAVEALGRLAPKAAALLDSFGEEILTVYQLPEAHRKRMRSINMLDKVNQEIKRRTRSSGSFPTTGLPAAGQHLNDGAQSGMDGTIHLNVEVNAESAAAEPVQAAA